MVDNSTLEKFIERGITKGNLRKNKKNLDIYDFSQSKVYADCVFSGYADIARTFSFEKGKSPAKIRDNNKDTNPFKNLTDEIRKYFKSNDKCTYDYDSFKKAVEKDFSEMGISHVRVGQSQKIINMAFKYLMACYLKTDLKGNVDYSIFEPCNMPLDSNVALWLLLETKKEYCKWSYLDDIDCYKNIQKDIRERLSKDKFVLEHEFEIWNAYAPEEVIDFSATKKN